MTHESVLFGDFWDDWSHRFETEWGEYITPLNDTVVEYADGVVNCSTCAKWPDAERLWRKVGEEVTYNLSREWKTPEQTVGELVGDCEDVVFLMASLLPHAGFRRSEVVIGYLTHPNGDKEEHAWNRLNGRVIDATGVPSDARKWEYEEVNAWNVETSITELQEYKR